MNNENLKKFLEKLFSDKDLADKMSACKSPEEAYEIASSVQDGFTFEEFTEFMTALNESVANSELSEEDLARVAGGEITDEKIKMALTATGVGAGVVAAGAAGIGIYAGFTSLAGAAV